MTHRMDRFATGALAALLGLTAPVAFGAGREDRGFLAPGGGERFAAGVVVTVRWDVPEGTEERDEAELLLSLDDGVTFPIRLTAQAPSTAREIRWRVPALSTDRGRLALRVGEEGRPETERIEAVSERFSILAGEGAPDGELLRGPTEWWTRQALSDIGAEDLLSESVRGQPNRLVRAEDHPEISEPSSSILPCPGPSGDESSGFEAAALARRTSPPTLRRSAPLPLRE